MQDNKVNMSLDRNFLQQAQSVTQWASFMQTIRPEPLWGETLSLRQSVTLLRQNHSSKAGNVVHPQAIYRELCYKQTQQGKSCKPQPNGRETACPQ